MKFTILYIITINNISSLASGCICLILRHPVNIWYYNFVTLIADRNCVNPLISLQSKILALTGIVRTSAC
jgi:hypothetical protein